MPSRPTLRFLMTGAAVASLSTVAVADGWSGLIAFGGRDYDSGQYVSYEAVFPEPGEGIGDGRQRGTNRVEDGGRASVVTQRVSRKLGFGTFDPSQPQSHAAVPTPGDGWNYAAIFYGASDIRASIDGAQAATSDVFFRESDGTVTEIDGRSRPGLLRDPDRAASVEDALVLVGSAQRDLRWTADVHMGLDGTPSLNETWIERDAFIRDSLAGTAATDITGGVAALTDAGAGLVVVSNAYDAGAMPEVGGDNRLLVDADRQLQAREDQAALTQAALTAAQSAVTLARTTQADAQTDFDNNPNATTQAALDDANAALTQRQAEAATALATRDEFALTAHEQALRPQFDAALADPSLIGTIRTAATDTYNADLVRQLRGNDGNVVLIDQHALVEAVIADPARFGLSAEFDQANDCFHDNPLHPCNEVGAEADELLFADGVNLTGAGHQLLADQITAMVQAPATLSGIPAIGISGGRGVSDAGRDQVSREQAWKAGVAPFVSGVASRVQLGKSEGFPQHDGGFYSGVAGVRYVPAPGYAVGVAGGYQKITTPGGEPNLHYDGSALFGTAFAGINTGPVFGSVTATYGKVDYDEVTRYSRIGPATIANSGSTDGTVLGFTGEAGVRLVRYDILRAGPIANVSHWRSTVKGYAEDGWAATAVRTGDLETRSTRAGLGAFLEAGELVEGQGSVFRAKVLYGHEFGDETKTASVTPLGDNAVGSFSTEVRGVSQAPLEFGAEVVLGYRGVLTTFGYDGILGDISDHRFRVGVSMPL